MQYDVIVVGAGSMGMSTGYFLAKQGKKYYFLMLLIHPIHTPVIMVKPALSAMHTEKVKNTYHWRYERKNCGAS